MHWSSTSVSSSSALYKPILYLGLLNENKQMTCTESERLFCVACLRVEGRVKEPFFSQRLLRFCDDLCPQVKVKVRKFPEVKILKKKKKKNFFLLMHTHVQTEVKPYTHPPPPFLSLSQCTRIQWNYIIFQDNASVSECDQEISSPGCTLKRIPSNPLHYSAQAPQSFWICKQKK